MLRRLPMIRCLNGLLQGYPLHYWRERPVLRLAAQLVAWVVTQGHACMSF